MRIQWSRVYLPDATLSILRAGEEAFFVLEDPPRLPMEPATQTGRCVPEGLYELVPHSGRRWQDTFALVNPELGVVHWPAPGKRAACVLHPGNTVADTEGCPLIGLGASFSPVPRLIESARGTARLLALLRADGNLTHEALITS